MSTNQTWRKSTRSNSQSACVELAVGATQTSIRDTKNRTAGALTFNAGAWGRFLMAAKNGEFGVGDPQ